MNTFEFFQIPLSNSSIHLPRTQGLLRFENGGADIERPGFPKYSKNRGVFCYGMRDPVIGGHFIMFYATKYSRIFGESRESPGDEIERSLVSRGAFCLRMFLIILLLRETAGMRLRRAYASVSRHFSCWTSEAGREAENTQWHEYLREMFLSFLSFFPL